MQIIIMLLLFVSCTQTEKIKLTIVPEKIQDSIKFTELQPNNFDSSFFLTEFLIKKDTILKNGNLSLLIQKKKNSKNLTSKIKFNLQPDTIKKEIETSIKTVEKIPLKKKIGFLVGGFILGLAFICLIVALMLMRKYR